jgi:hypothetical protein
MGAVMAKSSILVDFCATGVAAGRPLELTEAPGRRPACVRPPVFPLDNSSLRHGDLPNCDGNQVLIPARRFAQSGKAAGFVD